MDAPPPEPVWPEGITVEGFERGRDEQLFHDALEDAFRDHWRWSPTPHDEWVRANVEDDPDFDGSLWFRAMDGDEVAGHGHRPSPDVRGPGGRVDRATWACARPWRGRGIGLALLRQEFGALYRAGHPRGAARRGRGQSDGRHAAVRARRHARGPPDDVFMKSFG